MATTFADVEAAIADERRIWAELCPVPFGHPNERVILDAWAHTQEVVFAYLDGFKDSTGEYTRAYWDEWSRCERAGYHVMG